MGGAIRAVLHTNRFYIRDAGVSGAALVAGAGLAGMDI
jgi:hypothetical protein